MAGAALTCVVAATPVVVPAGAVSHDATAPCYRWVSPDGRDQGPGSRRDPWATIEHAAEAVPDRGCTVWVLAGRYEGATTIERRFRQPITFRSLPLYRAELVAGETVLDIDGARNVAIEGFDIHHNAATDGYVVIIDRDAGSNIWSEDIVLRNNVIHDSRGDDLLKVHNGVRRALVTGNLFFNQGDNEQHIDVNSVTDVTISNNVFFNDLPAGEDRKAFIVVKDSNAGDDGLLGSRRVRIARNVFLSYQGGNESFVQLGNDGKPYFEVDGVSVESNLFVGDSDDEVNAPLGVRGGRNIRFVNNTVVGDLPSEAYALWASTTGDNPMNRDLLLANNIWSDPTGSMSPLTTGRSTVDLELTNNLYWNGERRLPGGELAEPTDDRRRVVGDPELPPLRGLDPPQFDAGRFASGSVSIRHEFLRLVRQAGTIGATSAAVDAADASLAPITDITGRRRDQAPDLGACEAQ